jgi:hypothetical protein
VKRIVRHWIVMSVLVVLALGVALTKIIAGTWPYQRPVIALEPGGQDATFDGISQLISDAKQRGTQLHVLWVHGMCSHDMRWVADRATRIAKAMSGTATQTNVMAETGGLTRVLYQIHTRNGDFDATFVLWSPMTQPFKRTLTFDSPGDDPENSFPYQRATMNGELKTKLVNDCLSDAVVYSGQHGDPIRVAMKQAVCHELGGVAVVDKPCDLTHAIPERPTVVITESLGSKLLLDAAQAVYDEADVDPEARAEMDRRFASVQTIFLMANQIPLLDIASPMPPNSSLDRMVDMMHSGRMSVVREQGAPLPMPTVVAFSDPNDLLSYRLLPTIVNLARATLINVIVSNARTWLGFLERPDSAHCGYPFNASVIGLIAYGHKVGEAMPEVPVVETGHCG